MRPIRQQQRESRWPVLMVVIGVIAVAVIAIMNCGCTKSYFYVDTYGDPSGEATFNANTPWGNTNVSVKNGILMAGPTLPDLYTNDDGKVVPTPLPEPEPEP